METKQFISCSLWTLSPAEDMSLLALNQIKSVFDPSAFTAEIIQCHATCGDDYYSCSFLKCDSNIKNPAETATKLDKTIYLNENKTSFWSRFLHLFTFGFLGSVSYDETRIFKHSDDTDKDFEVSAELEQLCMKNCTNMFHKCYRKCICDIHLDVNECKPTVKVFPDTYAPILIDRFGGVVRQPPTKDEKIYSFDWDKYL